MFSHHIQEVNRFVLVPVQYISDSEFEFMIGVSFLHDAINYKNRKLYVLAVNAVYNEKFCGIIYKQGREHMTGFSSDHNGLY